jgi:predicted transcriptional regulator
VAGSDELLKKGFDRLNSAAAKDLTPSAEVQGSSGARRTTVDIYADILEVVKRHGGRGRITRISYGVGMPVDRLKKFLDKLSYYGLVRGNEIEAEDGGSALAFIVTPRGQEFLEVYWKMKAFLDVFAES